MSFLEEEARRRERAEDLRRWRSRAGGAVYILALLVGVYVIKGVPITGPLPLREELFRFEGTIEEMRIGRSDHGCYGLFVRIHNGRERIEGANRLLWDEMKTVPLLAPGTVVSVLVEPTRDEYVVWEMKSGGWQLIGYEQMRAARQKDKRGYRVVGALVFVFCLPFLWAVGMYLWKEFRGLTGRDRP
jgi:hypothetical protein